jgi:hypothetical protein
MSRLIRGLGAYDRDQLIKRYIGLLDEIEQYHLDDGDRDAELKLAYEASNLMGATLGRIGHIPLEGAKDAPVAAMSAIMNWQSAFARKTDGHLWDEVISELMRFEFGDLPEMLKPAPRKQNQHPLRGRMIFMRLEAIGWLEFFRKNHPTKAKDYQQEIAEAYGVEFETLNTWRVKLKKQFGKEYFSNWLAHANSALIETFTSEEYKECLLRDGRRFKDLSSSFKEYDE